MRKILLSVAGAAAISMASAASATITITACDPNLTSCVADNSGAPAQSTIAYTDANVPSGAFSSTIDFTNTLAGNYYIVLQRHAFLPVQHADDFPARRSAGRIWQLRIWRGPTGGVIGPVVRYPRYGNVPPDLRRHVAAAERRREQRQHHLPIRSGARAGHLGDDDPRFRWHRLGNASRPSPRPGASRLTFLADFKSANERRGRSETSDRPISCPPAGEPVSYADANQTRFLRVTLIVGPGNSSRLVGCV